LFLTTVPSPRFQEYKEKEITIINPAQFPEKSQVTEYLEPVVLGTVITPTEYTGKIMALCQVGHKVGFSPLEQRLSASIS
jgi:translation elongation factor EF-4